MKNKIIQILTAILALLIAFCLPAKNSTQNDSLPIVKCTYGSALKKYERGCIPKGPSHFCSVFLDSIKKGKLLEFLANTGKWKTTYDTSDEYFFVFQKDGKIIQYTGESKSDKANPKVIRNGSISLFENFIQIQGILIYKEDKGMIESKESTNILSCSVGAPEQVTISLGSGLTFEPYHEISKFYEPESIEIEYPSGIIRQKNN